MDLSRLLTADPQVPVAIKSETGGYHAQSPNGRFVDNSTVAPSGSARSTPPANMAPKSIVFEYLLVETSSHHRARLPMRVNIYPHDGTDSIITTVKNFYGLYDGNSVSFEDKDGNTLIARYENFTDKMTVYVRVIDEVGSKAGTPSVSASPRRPRLQAPFDPQPMIAGPNFGISRPPSRTAKKRSASPPTLAGHRSHSVSTVKSRAKRSRVGSAQGDGEYDSESDGGNASVTSSRRGKLDVLASAEISVDNIVEGGRRKRARFDSSELPLFVPSQVPGSISSISPQRRTGPPAAASPFQANQHTFAYNLVPSPQSFSHTDSGYRTATFSASGSSYAARRQNGHFSGRPSISGAQGILPTPETTVASVISDEDVALQLMRLGDASNYSAHGRTSTSTMDDGLSGKADASSGEDTDYGSGDDLPEGDGMVTDDSGEEYFDGRDGSFKGESDGILPEDFYRMSKKASNGSKSGKSSKTKKNGAKGLSMMMGSGTQDMQRKLSASHLNFQHFQQPLGMDEEDLSSKPRCQRCRKSKKGCDRQRPCGRCRDAGIGIEGCISEEENNGRKGRYGRHMGVSVKKGGDYVTSVPSIEGVPVMHQPQPQHYHQHQHARPHQQQHQYQPQAQSQSQPAAAMMMSAMSMAPPPSMMMSSEKSKKRKR